MPALGRVSFQVADDEIALVLGTGIWWCSALSTQHPLMQFMQYTEVLSLHFVFVRVHLFVAPQGPSSNSRQSRRNWENTPPQVGHGFLNLSFGTLSCQGTGEVVQRVGGEAPIGLEVFPGHRGSLVSRLSTLESI